MQTTHLHVNNIRCASCVAKIEAALKEHGIHDANINFAARKVSFPNNGDTAVVASILKEIGYDTVAVNNEAEAAKQEKKQTSTPASKHTSKRAMQSSKQSRASNQAIKQAITYAIRQQIIKQSSKQRITQTSNAIKQASKQAGKHSSK